MKENNAPPALGKSNLFKLLFGLSSPVSRTAYATTGIVLMIVKYLVDTSVICVVTGRMLTPLDYLNPIYSLRESEGTHAPDWLLLTLLLWTVPFFWIGVSMSVRRAVDAGLSPWTGMLFFVPILNYLMMVEFCFLPSVPQENTPKDFIEISREESFKSAVLAIFSSVLLTFLMIWVSVYLLKNYGTALFFGTPLLLGAVNAYIFNFKYPRSFKHTIGITSLGVLFAGTALLLFALEGLICLIMAAPIAFLLSIGGASIGFLIANSPRAKPMHAAFTILLLPLLAIAEKAAIPEPLYEVITKIEINAPPEKVWPNVIGFSELPPATEWLFNAGISYPQRARIEGEGVGAMRYCEFSTGAFVEPITAWEKPNRLAFDVSAQPLAMQEWSPYKYLHPPHLDGTIRSKRGEFRLIPLAHNRTLLEGHTWYEFDMRPVSYWTMWSDLILHGIHRRVLTHIKNLSENN